MDRDDVKVVHDGQANNTLVKQLMSIKKYINDDVPEWKQLVLIGGFVIDVVKELKWEEQPKYSKSGYGFDKKPIMNCDEICEGITSAVNHYLSVPYADELNAAWEDWYFDDTGKYANVETIWDMYDVICERLEQKYPGILELEKKYFYSDIEED